MRHWQREEQAKAAATVAKALDRQPGELRATLFENDSNNGLEVWNGERWVRYGSPEADEIQTESIADVLGEKAAP